MPALQRLFNYVVPGMEELPGFLNRLLLSDVDVEILPSPLDVSEIEGDFTFIAVGSPGYNLAARYVEKSLHSIGRFTDDMTAVTLPGAPRYRVTTTPLCSGLGIPSGRHSTSPARQAEPLRALFAFSLLNGATCIRSTQGVRRSA